MSYGLIGIVIIIALGCAWRDWTNYRERSHRLDAAVKMSEQETQRMKLFIAASGSPANTGYPAESRAIQNPFKTA